MKYINGQVNYRHVIRRMDRALEHGISLHHGHCSECDRMAQAVNIALDQELLFSLNSYRDYTPDISQAELRVAE